MYRLRFLLIMLRCLLSRPRGILESYDLHFRAIPLVDTDALRLFTQTYSLYMGLARWHYVFSSQFKIAALKNGWVPVTTSETITYRRSIRALDKVTVRSQLLCWNERRFFLSQTFLVGEDERASALVEGLLRGPKSHLNPVEVFKVLGAHEPSPAMPKDVTSWCQMRSSTN